MPYSSMGPQYYDDKDRGMQQRMDAVYAEAITLNQSFWAEADIDTRFYSGDQTVYSDLYGNIPVNRRKTFSFNRIRRIKEMIEGYQRKNRKSIITIPIENGDTETADQFTKIMMWIAKTEGVLETISDSFGGSLVTGLNLLQVWMDYRTDPVNGNIKVDTCSYNSFLIDPYFRKHDLSDCNFIWKRSYLTKRECISILPDKSEDIMGMWAQDNKDGKFQFMPEANQYSFKNLLSYDEFYYRDYRNQKMLLDTESGEVLEWRSQDDDKLKQFIQKYPTINVIEQEIPTVNLAVVVQGKVMYDGPNPLGIDNYPFVPVLSYYEPQLPYYSYRVQGVVRGLRDAQYLYNRRKVIELDILESQLNSGFIYKENALVNPKDIFQSGQGRGIALKDEAQMTDVQQIQSPVIPQTTIELSGLMAKEIEEISGVNSEMLGSADDDKAGILSMLRQSAGTTTLQSLFDNLDRSQKLLGNLFINIIQANWTPGKIMKILEGEQPSQQFYNKAFGKYHAAVEDGLNTTTQQQMQFAQMLHLRQANIPISDQDLIEASTIQGKKKIIENMAQAQQQQQQMTQMQMQAQQAQLDAQLKAINAKAAADEGLAIERTSRVDENRALAEERRAEALKDEDMALLNKVKALKELEEMDLAHIHKLITMANALKTQDVVQHEVTQQIDSMVR